MFLIAAVGIFGGTVYGGYHYAVDAIGGVVVGITFGILGPQLHAALERRLGIGRDIFG